MIVASFVMFARDQVAGASLHQQAELVVGSTVPSGHQAPMKTAQPRAFVDHTATTLTSPFHSVISSSNPWVDHGVPALLGLLAYGVGVGFLARFTRLTP
jgi:hypothetical protein